MKLKFPQPNRKRVQSRDRDSQKTGVEVETGIVINPKTEIDLNPGIEIDMTGTIWGIEEEVETAHI